MTPFAPLFPAAALLAAAATAVAPLPDTTAATATADDPVSPYVVVLKDTASRAPARALAAEAAESGDEVGPVYEAALDGFAVRTTAARAAALAADPRVASVEADTVFHITGAGAGTDTPTGAGAEGTALLPQSPAPWSLDRIDQRELPLDGSYTYATKAGGVTVYILDTGINTRHQEFGGRARAGHSAVFLEGSRDCNGHGTHVAGTVGGETYGVAKGVSLVSVKVADCRGDGRLSGMLKGLDWVVKDAARTPASPAVANMSMGGSRSRALDAAVLRIVSSGITFVAAAGNDGRNACGGSPASVPQAVTVGATDAADRRAPFSNHGSCVDLFAPGVAVTSARKDSTTGTARSSGTSMAAPHVAGAAALLLAGGTVRTPAQVSDALVRGAVAGRITGLPAGTPNLLLHVPGTTSPTGTATATARPS
ncbi:MULTISPECIES: S8 family peptidase [Streptomyces]|uniref:S8 family peptidase n=1 Tax=Streptomyces TaxID=1883 RepID=UPI0005F9846C|nr:MULTISPECIES: S8 family peptidase [unclassified Streptomyces]KJY20441.1 peptidase S8 [Streptomyces sp. NRRL S-104]